MTNLQLGAQQQALQQLQAVMDAQRASADQRERMRCKFSWWTCRIAGNLNTAEAETRTDAETGAPRRHRSFIESRAFSKLTNFDSTKAASCKDWAFKFENMAAAVVPWSREALEWAAQQETPILTVDDVEAGPDSVEIDPQVCVALAELLEGGALDIEQNTTRGAGGGNS